MNVFSSGGQDYPTTFLASGLTSVTFGFSKGWGMTSTGPEPPCLLTKGGGATMGSFVIGPYPRLTERMPIPIPIRELRDWKPVLGITVEVYSLSSSQASQS